MELTQEQKNQVAYNDNAVKNYERNKIIKSIYEKKEQEAILLRRKELEETIKNIRSKQPKTIFLHNLKEIKVEDLDDEIISKEIEFWFDNYK